jgi:hypothetical protein
MINTVSIMSCSRYPSYLRDTLSTIDPSLDLEIFYQGSKDELSDIDADVFEVDRPHDIQLVHNNSQYNYAYILLNSTNNLIVEDDVYFSKNFVNYLRGLEEDINYHVKNVSERYAIALYSCYNWTHDSSDRPRLTPYPVDGFYGTQAMLYDEYTARNFGIYLMENIGVEAYDMALKSYINNEDQSVSLMASTRSLVQHIGEKTTGLGFFHQSSNYIGG